ncbi:MAG: hypothetical protein K9G38_05705 [Bacteroidales bacterium]|nr:hypothetical protein [Bacteroidales bacterium]
MKSIYAIIVTVFFTMNMMGQVTLPLLEEFDTPPDENQFGLFGFNNYGATDPAEDNYTEYTFSQDKTSFLSGENSAHMNIVATGIEWWTIQVRLENMQITGGDSLEVSFMMFSTKEVSFISRFEATDGSNDPQDENLTISPLEPTTFTYITQPWLNDGNLNYMIALGNSSSEACEVWIDSVSIKRHEGVPIGIQSNISSQDLELTQFGGELHIKGETQSRSLNVNFYDITGRQIRTDEISYTGSHVVEIPKYFNSPFFVVVRNGNDVLASKKMLLLQK